MNERERWKRFDRMQYNSEPVDNAVKTGDEAIQKRRNYLLASYGRQFLLSLLCNSREKSWHVLSVGPCDWSLLYTS
jgi:hypothetical protein